MPQKLTPTPIDPDAPTPPEHFQLTKTLSFTRDNPVNMWVNILMALLLLFFFSVFSNITATLVEGFDGAFLGGFSGWGILLVFTMAFVMMFLHESFHFLGMWALSGVKPVFTARSLNPRAIQAGVYFPPLVYAAMKLTPLVLLTAIYFFIAPILPLAWLPYSIFFFAGNAAYAAQDLLCVVELFRVRGTKLVEDRSERIFFYTRKD